MKKVIPMNVAEGETCRTIKANYFKMSLANFLHGGGTEQLQ